MYLSIFVIKFGFLNDIGLEFEFLFVFTNNGTAPLQLKNG